MRKIHYVGSLPSELTDKGPFLTMDWAIGVANAWPKESTFENGDHELTGVPCDLDDRWIIKYLDDLATRAAFRTLRAGDSSDYDTMPIYRVAKGHTLDADDVSMRRTDKLKRVISDYASLQAQTTGDLAPLRISLPSPLDLALFVFCGKVDLTRHLARTLRGSWLALRNLKHFTKAMTDDVITVTRHAEAKGVKVVWQLEQPSVLYAMNLVPGFLRTLVARHLADFTATLLALLWEHRLELHLCDGDLGHKAITYGTLAQIVEYLDQLGQRLDHRGVNRPPVHFPVACGDQPPPANPKFFEPLEDLDADWILYAGVVDENDLEASITALHLVEHYAGRTVAAVACACGLGRRTLDDARRAVDACRIVSMADRADQAEEAR